MADKHITGGRIAVIGLGRFGTSLAHELILHGTAVLAIDTNPKLVQAISESVTHAAVADSTDEEALRQLGISDFTTVVVAIGSDVQASILTTSLLADLRIRQIWAKATSQQHARILGRVGAHHVVSPESDMGERVAHLVTGRMLDYIEFDEDYAMVKTVAPTSAVGFTLSESAVRTKLGVTVVAVKRRGGDFTYAMQSTVIEKGDVLIVGGKVADIERFAELPS